MLRTETIPVADPELPSGATGLHVVEKGEGGVPMICVHGLGADHYEFIHQIRYFSNKRRCVAFDQRGHGRSPATFNMGIERSVLDLKSIADSLGIDEFILMGHSLGTMVAYDFASRYAERVKRLIIVAGSPAIRESRGTYIALRVIPRMLGLLDDRQRRSIGGLVARYVGTFGMRTSPDILRYYLSENPYVFTDKYFSACAKYMKDIADFDIRWRLGLIKCPTLVVHGALDLGIYAYTSIEAALLVPGAKLHIFPGCGHSPNVENTGNFNSLVEKFIEE